MRSMAVDCGLLYGITSVLRVDASLEKGPDLLRKQSCSDPSVHKGRARASMPCANEGVAAAAESLGSWLSFARSAPVAGEQFSQRRVVRDVAGPAARVGHGGVELDVSVQEPLWPGVVEVGQGPLLERGGRLLVTGHRARGSRSTSCRAWSAR